MERLVNRGTKTYRKSTRNVVERREIRHTNKNDGRTTIERKCYHENIRNSSNLVILYEE